MRPKVSVIIPSLNSPTVHLTIAALRAQVRDPSQAEIIVVGLDEARLVANDDAVRFIDTGVPRSAAANRNLGIQVAQGEILCFTDADCVPAPDWLCTLTAAYTDERVDVVGGGVVFDPGSYWALCDNLSWFFENLSSASPGFRDHLPTLNLSLRRAVIDRVGPLDESFHVAGEDMEWTRRMRARGYRLHFLPAAAVRHVAHRHTWSDVWRHGYVYGRFSGRTRIDRRAGTAPRFDWLIPRQWWLLLLAAPFLATLATARVVMYVFSSTAVIAAPGIWLSKLAWCAGASRGLRSAGERSPRR